MWTHGKYGATWKLLPTWHRIYHVFTYIYSLLIEKDICDRRKISAKLLCVCICLSSGDLFIFSIRVSSFYSYFFVLSILRYFPFHVVSKIIFCFMKPWVTKTSQIHLSTVRTYNTKCIVDTSKVISVMLCMLMNTYLSFIPY